MTYKIVINNNGQKRTERVEGVKSLHTHLALFSSQGWKIEKITRAILPAKECSHV